MPAGQTRMRCATWSGYLSAYAAARYPPCGELMRFIARLPTTPMPCLWENTRWLGVVCLLRTMLCPTSTILSTPMRSRQDARDPRKNSSASDRLRAVQRGRPARAHFDMSTVMHCLTRDAAISNQLHGDNRGWTARRRSLM